MSADGLLRLATDAVAITVDPLRGADIRSVVDRRTGVDVLFRSPWAEHAAEAVRRGAQLWHGSSAEAWLQTYAGGWQVLCPNAGGPQTRDGVEQGFHGETAVIPWTVEEWESSSATLHAELFTAPLRLRRTIELDDRAVIVTDTVTNSAPVAVDFDFQHHPAFGRPLVGPGAVLESGATSFWRDAEFPEAEDEPPIDLVPDAGRSLERLGWFTGFESAWVSLRNPALDLGVCLSWDADLLPNAWLWEDFNGTAGFPWFRRAYVLALEPSSTVTSGPGRARTMRLEPYASVTVAVRLQLCAGRRPVTGVDARGAVTSS